MSRRGFSLLELLVATGLFLFGFSAVYALFLRGVHARHEAELSTRCSIAAGSLLAEIRLRAGRETTGTLPREPADYRGDGMADTPDTGIDNLYPYLDQPGVWYCVRYCTDLTGDDHNAYANALHLNLVVIHQPGWSNADPVPIADFARLINIRDKTDPQEILDEAVSLGVAQSYDAIIMRQPSWP
ncbi:MAG: type IV pilus modification PilV family protein, partial [Planctomycetota bacterium]